MNADQQLAAYVMGVITVALGEARQRGFPAVASSPRVDVATGTWSMEVWSAEKLGKDTSTALVEVKPGGTTLH